MEKETPERKKKNYTIAVPWKSKSRKIFNKEESKCF